jgi:hypothetical protein
MKKNRKGFFLFYFYSLVIIKETKEIEFHKIQRIALVESSTPSSNLFKNLLPNKS